MTEDKSRAGLRFAGIGFEFAAAVGGLTVAGYWLDRKLGTAPLWTLIGLFVGLLGGTYNLIREVLPRKARRSSPRNGAEGPPEP
jgi:F0F1-type ATP synthase assembly protein I